MQAVQELTAFAAAAEVDLSGVVGVVVGDDVTAARQLLRGIDGPTELLLGPHATPCDIDHHGAVVHHYDDDRACPAATHAYDRLVVLAGALGGPIGLAPRLQELRRTLRPDGVAIVQTGPLSQAHLPGEPRSRPTLREIQLAGLNAGLAIVKARVDTPPVRLSLADHRAPLSELAVSGGSLLLVPLW